MSEEVQSGSSSLFYSLPRGRPYRTRQHLQKPCALPFRSPSEAFIPKCEQFLKLLSHEPQLFHPISFREDGRTELGSISRSPARSPSGVRPRRSSQSASSSSSCFRMNRSSSICSSICSNFDAAKARTCLQGEPPLSRTRRIRTNSARLNPTDSARRTSCTRLTASVG